MQAARLVWSKTPAFLNWHNEMAYLQPNQHLGAHRLPTSNPLPPSPSATTVNPSPHAAKYGVFACHTAPCVGGYTPLSDARRVADRLQGSAAFSPLPVGVMGSWW